MRGALGSVGSAVSGQSWVPHAVRSAAEAWKEGNGHTVCY